jgi:asparagine synthase (glutamine-hydrolysing)
LERYWDWDQIGSLPSITPDEAVNETTRRFQRAIDAMSAPPHRIGVYLSGGLDGRTILGFIDRPAPVTTITFGRPGCRDVVYGAELARRAGSRHHWFPLCDGRWVLEHTDLHLALTEGQHSWMHAHGISTLDAARKVIDVNLSGWDGGTIFGGYVDSYDRDAYVRALRDEQDLTTRVFDDFCQSYTWPGATNEEEEALFAGEGRCHLRGRAFDSLREEFARTIHYAPDRRIDYFYIANHVRRSTQNQIVFARSAIEVRCPFFDYGIIDFVYALPRRIHATPQFYRALLTARAPHLTLVPYEKDDRLPHSNRLVRHSHALVQKVKSRINRHIAPIFPQRPRLYADYEEYVRADLRLWAEGILFDQRTLDRGLFEPSAVRSLWERHLSGRELWTIGKVAPLVSLELVLRSLYDETV